MAANCVGDCLNIKRDAGCIHPGTTYASLHKWPVAEVEFVRSISHGGSQRRTSMVDSISCRQMYLRSYTFSRKVGDEDVREDLAIDGDHDDVGDIRNEQSYFGGRERKKAAKNSTRESKMMSHKAFVGRLVKKCLSCSFSNKVNMLKTKVYQ